MAARAFGVLADSRFARVRRPHLATIWVLSLWSPDPGPSTVRLSQPVRKGVTIALLVLAVVGVVLIQTEATLYLGVIFAFMAPVIAFQWWVGGHLLLHRKKEWALGILGPSIYLITLDQWAIREGVWVISDRFTTGIRILGVQLEQVLIYSVTTALVVNATVMVLRGMECRVRDATTTAGAS